MWHNNHYGYLSISCVINNHFQFERNTVLAPEQAIAVAEVNGINYIVNEEKSEYSTTYSLQRADLYRSVNKKSSTMASSIGLTQNEYSSLSQSVKTELENAKAVYIQETMYKVSEDAFISLTATQRAIYNRDKEQKGIAMAIANIPDFDSSNGYLKFRITATDTGELFSTGNRILYFNVEAEWLKLPYQRRDDYLAFAIPSDFRAISAPHGSSSWQYMFAPDKITPGIPYEGTMHGVEDEGQWWAGLLDGEYMLNDKSADANTERCIMSFNLPNKSNYYTPVSSIKCDYGYRVEEEGDGTPFNMKIVYGHDQTLFGAKAPDISINGVTISLGGNHNQYPHTVYSIEI